MLLERNAIDSIAFFSQFTRRVTLFHRINSVERKKVLYSCYIEFNILLY